MIAIALLRASLGAVVLISLISGGPWTALICLTAFGVAQLTDNLDGWIARRYSAPSVAGYLQDSISDKLFHVGCLLGLGIHFQLINVLLWGVLVREFILLGIRVIAPDLGNSLVRLRVYSIAYAVPLRTGIAAFFVGPFLAPSAASVVAGLGYGLLLAAVTMGMVGLVLALRLSWTAGALPTEPGASGRH